MFATLLLIRNIIDGGREATTLTPGAMLSNELMRLFPHGLGMFEVYLREVRDENLIPKSEHETYRVVEGERYILQLRPKGIIEGILGYLIVSLLVSVAVAVIAKVLTPKPKQADSNRDTEAISPNNALAGQTNTLRPGARVPDILGKMRCWPDLIANAQETWNYRTQWIIEWFVLGVGDYDIEHARLGETALAGITGCDFLRYRPGMTVPPILCVKRSPLVDNMSLLTESNTVSGGDTTTFTPPNTMTTSAYLPISIPTYGIPVRVDSPNNARLFDFRSGPAQSQANPPFVYTIYGNMVAETTANASFRPTNQLMYVPSLTAGNLWWDTNQAGAGDFTVAIGVGWVPQAGQVVRILCQGIQNVVGIIGSVRNEEFQFRFWLSTFSMGRLIPTTGPSYSVASPLWVYEQDYGEVVASGGLTRAAETLYTTWTDWMTAPYTNPQQLLLDFAFPQGLVWYNQNNRRDLTVQIEAQFKKLDAPASQASRTWTYTYATQAPLRFTQEIIVSQLLLPTTGSPYIQTRVRRVTAWKPDDNDNQYIWDTRWTAYASATQTASRVYNDVTLLKLTLKNTRSAASIGETSFNVIATRRLPTFAPAGIWMPDTATERWADSLVRRMKAADGAHKTDAEIDLVGIYNIQRQLDAIDGGDGGKIAMTLDQQQDIDTELQSIASIARCQLYRIGPKLYVERDQGGKFPIALFTGRSKHPDAETVSINLTSDADPDAVIIPWWDRLNDTWKQRELQWDAASEQGLPNVTAINALRIAPAQATWAQAYRRARYEWNRMTKRRETISVKTTEEGSLVHPGDVVNITDDVGNLSQTAGEVFDVRELDLSLDQEVDLSSGSYVLLLRSLDGRSTDTIAVSQLTKTDVRLARAPRFPIKGRDDALGSMYALYRTERSVVIPWLVTSIEPEERYITISATNWTEEVFVGDSAALPAAPVTPFTIEAHAMTEGVMSEEDIAKGPVR